jgi:hypothetical protein
MDSVEGSNKRKREPLIYVGGAVFMNVDVCAEVGNTPTALLRVYR